MAFESIDTGTEKLDARWYKRFEKLIIDDYEKLGGDGETRAKEQQRFLSGEVVNPTLDYPELATFDDVDKEEELLSLKEDVLSMEQNEIVKKIYRTKINESIATVRMLRAAKEGNDRRFAKYSAFIHGVPTPEHEAYVASVVRAKALKALNSKDEEKVQAATRILEIVKDIPEESEDSPYVSKDVLPEGQSIEGDVEGLEEAVSSFQEALTSLDLDDWNIVVDTEKGITGFSVSQEDKRVNIPSEENLKKRELTKKKLQGLIAHEIGTHALRRHNGERSKLQLLGIGLDRVMKGEEGVATYNEQLVTGAKEFAGTPLYFSVAVAKGQGGSPRNFRETFNVMRDYHIMTKNAAPDRAEKSDQAAWNECVRIFRGTTGATPGAVFTKDLAYMGNREIWTLVSKDSDVVETFSIGKFDPTNDRHVSMLTELGILDSDLEKI